MNPRPVSGRGWSLRASNSLETDARAIQIAYQRRLGKATVPGSDVTEDGSQAEAGFTRETSDFPTIGLAFPKEPPPKRSKEHLPFVRGQPCVICKQSPCDPHHLKFAQPRALGRKVSDEFTGPLCPRPPPKSTSPRQREDVVGQYADRTFTDRKGAVGRKSKSHRAARLSDRPPFAH
jgi:hypothetical protein